MKFEIFKEFIDNQIHTSQAFLEKKDNSLITSHIYIKACEKKLTIKATDYELFYKSEINNVDIIEEGETTINGKNLLEIINRLKSDKITFYLENNNLIIKQNNSIFKLPTFDPQEYPTFPTLNNEKNIKIDINILLNSFKKIFPTISTNNPKIELNSALIDIDENISFVSTDIQRLSVVKTLNLNNEKNNLLIPKRAINEIGKIFFNDIEIFYNENYLKIEENETIFITSLINGKYPNYKGIIPNENDFIEQVKINKKLFTEAIKLITFATFDINIKFDKEKQEIIFKTLDLTNESNTSINLDQKINNSFEININGKYFLDFFNVSDDEITLKYQGDKPIMLESNNFFTIMVQI